MTDDELKGLVARIAIAQEQTDAQIAGIRVQLAKIDVKLDRLVEKNGDIRNSQGLTHAELDWLERKYGGEKSNAEVAEEFFFNAFAARSVLAGVRYDSVSGYGSSVHISTGLKDGFALFLTNEREVFVVEVEYEAQEKDLRYLLDVKVPNFPIMKPEYADLEIRPTLAAFHISDELKRAALEQGVTVVQKKGDQIESFAA